MEFKYVLPYTNCYTLPAVLITNKEEWMREILRRLWLIQELLQHKEAPLREYKIALEINTAWCQMIEGCGDKVALPEKNDIKKIERLKTITTHITPITHRQPTTLTQQQNNHPATRSQPEIGRPRLACLKN